MGPHRALIAVAGFTDIIDGWLARHEKSESTTGALLDPLADRIFVLVAISTYLIEGRLTTGQYFIFLTRDLATAVGFVVAKIIPTLRPAVFRARMLGKIVTVVQLITLVAIIVVPELTNFLILSIGLISAASIVDYSFALWRGRTLSEHSPIRCAGQKRAAAGHSGSGGALPSGRGRSQDSDFRVK